jgi:hypothetical protein
LQCFGSWFCGRKKETKKILDSLADPLLPAPHRTAPLRSNKPSSILALQNTQTPLYVIGLDWVCARVISRQPPVRLFRLVAWWMDSLVKSTVLDFVQTKNLVVPCSQSTHFLFFPPLDVSSFRKLLCFIQYYHYHYGEEYFPHNQCHWFRSTRYCQWCHQTSHGQGRQRRWCSSQ